MVFLIGRDKYIQAMTAYFKKYLWGNTKLSDFMEIYNSQLGGLGKENPALDIQKWSEDWLGTPGTNCLELQWTPGNSSGKII